MYNVVYKSDGVLVADTATALHEGRVYVKGKHSVDSVRGLLVILKDDPDAFVVTMDEHYIEQLVNHAFDTGSARLESYGDVVWGKLNPEDVEREDMKEE